MNATSALRQSWIIMLRDLKHWQREPWTPLFGIAFTIMLVLVFGYLFGGSIELPGGGTCTGRRPRSPGRFPHRR